MGEHVRALVVRAQRRPLAAGVDAAAADLRVADGWPSMNSVNASGPDGMSPPGVIARERPGSP
jgi:hypothetical protein